MEPLHRAQVAGTGAALYKFMNVDGRFAGHDRPVTASNSTPATSPTMHEYIFKIYLFVWGLAIALALPRAMVAILRAIDSLRGHAAYV